MIRIAFVFACFVGIWGRADAALIITPATSTLHNGQSLSLAVSGADASGVVWSVSSATGLLVSTGTSAVYTVPSTLNKAETVTVQVTSVSNSSLTVKTILFLVPVISIAVSPASADVNSGGKVALHANVLGTLNTGVKWSVNPSALGKVDASGNFTASTNLVSDATATVTAIAQAQTSKTSSIPVRIHANELYFSTGPNGLQSVVYNGVDYNYLFAESLLSYVFMQFPDGTSSALLSKLHVTNTSVTVTRPA